jgi:hypothetical protein
MAQVSKIDSNITGLRYTEEASLGVLPASPIWIPLEPNSYNDFGGQVTTVARNPINPSRQRKKGTPTDLDASGGFNTDLTQTNLQDLLQGFFFADAREKGKQAVTSVDGTAETYAIAATAGFLTGSLVYASGFSNSANNGLKTVTSVSTDVDITVSQDIADETPGAGAQVAVVGFEFDADDAEIDASQDLPALVTTTQDLTQLGIVPGEWVFVGGDVTGDQFSTEGNNGFKRVKSVAANRMVFDKTVQAMSTETTTSVSLKLFLGRVLKNETGSLIKRRTYQLERTLGAPDTASPNDLQAEYLRGSVANELSVSMPSTDKITADVSFVSIDNEQRTATQGVKNGDRPALEEADAFNTSNDLSRIKMASVSATNAAPDPLFGFVTELSLTVNNNVSPNKALGVFGAFDTTAGTFTVNGEITAYFSDVSAIAAVRNNADITLDIAIVKDNKGIVVDIPLITLGNGRANVEQDSPITLPLSMDAASGAKVDPNMDHTLLMAFFDYLPNAADL